MKTRLPRKRSLPRLDSSTLLRPLSLSSLDIPYTDEPLERPLIKDVLRKNQGLLNDDVEAQTPLKEGYSQRGLQVAAEYEVPTRTKLFYLGAWFALNLILTIYNKAVLGEVRTVQLQFSVARRVNVAQS